MSNGISTARNTLSTRHAETKARKAHDRKVAARKAKVLSGVGFAAESGTMAIDILASTAYGMSVVETRTKTHGLSKLVESPAQRQAGDTIELALGVIEVVKEIEGFISQLNTARLERKARKHAERINAERDEAEEARTIELKVIREEAAETMAKAEARYGVTLDEQIARREREAIELQQEIDRLRDLANQS